MQQSILRLHLENFQVNVVEMFKWILWKDLLKNILNFSFFVLPFYIIHLSLFVWMTIGILKSGFAFFNEFSIAVNNPLWILTQCEINEKPEAPGSRPTIQMKIRIPKTTFSFLSFSFGILVRI